MEENQPILLNQCRSQISSSGKWMNLFSIFAAISMALMAVGGILLLNYGNNLSENMPSAWEQAASAAGIVLILLAGALLYPLKLVRQAVKISRQVRVSTDIAPMAEALTVTRRLWRYMTWFLFLCLGLACLAVLLAFLFFSPVL